MFCLQIHDAACVLCVYVVRVFFAMPRITPNLGYTHPLLWPFSGLLGETLGAPSVMTLVI